MKRSPRNSQLAKLLSNAARESASATLFFHQAVATRLGLHPTDLKCAEIVARADKISAGDLAAQCGLTTGAATAMLDRLEALGLVRRERDPLDRRRVFVRPGDHPEEAAKIAALFAPLEAGIVDLCEQHTEHELKTVLEFVERVRELVETETRRLNEIKNS